MITRAAYMKGKATHEEYYGQFVTPALLTYLEQRLGARIRESKDIEHFNDVPLGLWDRLWHFPAIATQLDIANGGGGTSLSDWVCVYKTAARKLREDKQ